MVFLFEDEFSLSNTATVSYSWNKKGRQPLIKCKQNKRERQTVFGSVDIMSGQLVINFADRGNYKTFKKHLKKILKTYRKASKIILYLDNVRYHHAKKLKEFLVLHPKLELIYLPSYSPDLNPIERVWWLMRKQITHNRWVESLKERKSKFWKMFSFFLIPNQTIKNICVFNF